MAELKDQKPEGHYAKADPKAPEGHDGGLLERFHAGRMDAPKCPQCEGKTERYDGPNPHKQGSYECPRCKFRVRHG